jgi:hypothetical protein
MSEPLTLGEGGLDAATGILTAVPLALILWALILVPMMWGA